MTARPSTTGRTAADTLSDFLDAMEAAGIVPRDRGQLAARLASGSGLVRFRCHGERRDNGWAVLHLDGIPAGSFGNWRLGIANVKWRDGRACATTASDKAAMARVRLEAQAARLRAYDDAARRSLALWAASSPATADHPYLAAKQMDPAGLRVNGEALLVPMTDTSGRFWSLQSIYPDGRKRFFKEGRVEAMLWRRGDPGAVIALGEGVATMAAVHAATGLCSIAAFSSGNLATAARAIRVQWPQALVLVCADDDAGSLPNKGMEAANAAVRAYGGLVARPPRPPGWPEGKGWDFADTFTTPGGAEAIRRALDTNQGTTP